MAYTLNNYFKFDLAQLRLKGYKVGTPIVLYEDRDASDGRVTSFILRFVADKTDPARAQLNVLGSGVDQTIDLIRVPSNLGVKGGQWYFVCPITFTRCRTLYYDGNRLVARQALAGIFYQCQHHGPSSRGLWKTLDPVIKHEIMMRDWFYRPRVKKYYRDKPTRMTQRFLKNINRMQAIKN